MPSIAGLLHMVSVLRGKEIELPLWAGQWQPHVDTLALSICKTSCNFVLPNNFFKQNHNPLVLCMFQSCSQSFPCAGRAVRNAFLSHGPYPAKDKIHLARIIRYACLCLCGSVWDESERSEANTLLAPSWVAHGVDAKSDVDVIEQNKRWSRDICTLILQILYCTQVCV